MKIQLKQVKIKELFDGYKDEQDAGIVGYGGKLNIRPAYQREFVYKDKQRDAVIRSVRSGFPLNTMYWVKNSDGTYELLDGQQRSISICQYLNGDFSYQFKYFKGLTQEERDQINNYELQVYICEGTDKEKLEWFRTINVAGEELTDQELLNINYTGPWLTNAKEKFSKNNCAAYRIAKDYVKGSPIRQEFLETALEWISDNDIQSYMASHQFDENANDLWVYFQKVINWIKVIFPNYRREMKGLNWGKLYDTYRNTDYDPDKLESEIVALMQDDDVTKKSGIYEYLLSGKIIEKALNIRAFTDLQKRKKFEEQKGVCPICGETFTFEEMEGDHITPWKDGGKTDLSNLQMICKHCNRTKSSK